MCAYQYAYYVAHVRFLNVSHLLSVYKKYFLVIWNEFYETAWKSQECFLRSYYFEQNDMFSLYGLNHNH